MMCCYYPTTTVVIDDDILFLSAIQSELENCKTYSSPSKAIQYLKNSHPFNRVHSQIVNNPLKFHELNQTDGDFAYHINLHHLHHEIYLKDRFDDVSILIIDYHMPEMNGIEVCEKLK